MEFTGSPVLIWSSVVLTAALLLLVSKWKSINITKKRPPGPTGWPVFGNMFDLGTMPHQTLYSLRFKYGPVLCLQLGSVNTLVIQSAKAATELFKNHDLPFCGRKHLTILTALNYYQGSLAVGQYGPYWRILRRICAMELQGSKKIDEKAPMRRNCVDDMIRWIQEDAAASRARGDTGEVNLPHFIFCMAFNLMGNLIISRDLLDPRSKDGLEFFDAMDKIMRWVGAPNVADLLPFLKWFDPQGLKRNMVRDLGRAMDIVSRFVKERHLGKEKVKDFLDALLEYEGDGKEGPAKISDRNINIIILEMFLAGTETTSSTIEWAMTELLRKPELMRKVKEELDRVIGSKRKVEESDIDELPYLQAVVKETLRLHPALPLLIPRNTIQDTNFMGYDIAKNTQVFVNAWAIGRDPDAWEDPLSFKPERFLGSNIEYKGQNFELIPFGSGRRICVGLSIAHRVLHLGLASLLNSFDWQLGSNITPETMDMNERFGITLRKSVPLKAIPKRHII